MIKLSGGQQKFLLALVYFAGLFWRFVYIFDLHPITNFFYSDMQSYSMQTVKFAHHGSVLGPYDTLYPPGASFLFARFYVLGHSWIPVEILMFLLSAAVPILVAMIAYMIYGRRASWISLVVASLYPAFVIYSGFLLSEIPFTFAFLLAFLVLVAGLKRETKGWRAFGLWGLAAGLCFAAAITIRSSGLLPFLLIVAAVLVLCFCKRAAWSHLTGVILGSTLLLLPLTVRCSHLNQQFCFVNSSAQMNILMGHHGKVGEFTFKDLKVFYVWNFGNPTAVQQGATAKVAYNFGVTDGRAAGHAAWVWIKAHPGQAFADSLRHVRDLFWGSVPWPPANTPDRRTIVISEWLFRLLILIPASVYLILAVLKKVKFNRYEVLLVLPFIGIIITVFLTVGEPRYRIPFDGFAIILAAHVYELLIKRWLKKS